MHVFFDDPFDEIPGLLVGGYMVLLTPDKSSKLNPGSLYSPIKWVRSPFHVCCITPT